MGFPMEKKNNGIFSGPNVVSHIDAHDTRHTLRALTMWPVLVVVISVYRLLKMLLRRRRAASEIGARGLLKLNVAKAFQAVYGGEVYQALRIPDAGGLSHQHIDAILLSDRKIFVFSVQTIIGNVRTRDDRTWLQTDLNGNTVVHQNMVTQLHEKISVLADYIARRGVILPIEFFNPQIVFVDPMASPEQDILLQPEVISYEKWEDIRKKASAANVFGITSSASTVSRNKDQKLDFILSTAPTWDRLEMRDGGILFGEFLNFRGQATDLEALAIAKRSKIKQYETFPKWNIWNFLGSEKVTEVVLVCTLRDYRQSISVKPEKVDFRVKGGVQIIFQVEGSRKPQSYDLQDVAVLSLRA